MPLEKKKIKLKLYDDGKVEKEPCGENEYGGYTYYFSNGKEHGTFVYCYEGKEDYWLRRMVNEKIKETELKIKSLKQTKARLLELKEKVTR